VYACLNLYDLPYQFFSGWPVVFFGSVPGNDWALLFSSALKYFKERVFVSCRFLFRSPILYELYWLPIHRLLSNPLVLSDWGKQETKRFVPLNPEWNHFSPVYSLDNFHCNQLQGATYIR
jgi:hypothetical protein